MATLLLLSVDTPSRSVDTPSRSVDPPSRSVDPPPRSVYSQSRSADLLPPPATAALPALDLLGHEVVAISADPEALANAPVGDVILVDATTNLSAARSVCRLLAVTDTMTPVIVVVTEGGFSAVSEDWGFTDLLLQSAPPAEVEARIRLSLAHPSYVRGSGAASASTESRVAGHRIRSSGLEIDEANYSIKMHGQPIDLTYKEFELLRFLARHPARVFTREQLLDEVWGYDYYGGTRTVDVHVRRLRAKLGDLESLIGTVRNVGYRFTAAETAARAEEQPALEGQDERIT